MARKMREQMGLPFLHEQIAESTLRALELVCDEKTNAVIDSLNKVFEWSSTTWWQSLHTRMMKEDSENRIRWKHKWRWHNRGNVCNKMATCWAGDCCEKEAKLA